MTPLRVLIDDLLLAQVLFSDQPTSFGEPEAELYTTGIWYHRLARAVATPSVTGSLSRRLGDASPGTAGRILRSVAQLPESIGLISLRELAWPMGELLADGTRLNLLSREALAAAHHLQAEIWMSDRGPNPNLTAAATEQGIPVHLVPA